MLERYAEMQLIFYKDNKKSCISAVMPLLNCMDVENELMETE